ncbi:glycoside hydrolase family 3 N-terminal domain-containing protein [Micromonospora sp. DT201]|uniref:glycoside hydrolase family 3 N-terminal domain-containing protein n=1 Tax=Micromonospora sp. DT201 TaxID=3393442 RepID=UPI003CF07640
MRSQSPVGNGAAPWHDPQLSPTERAEALLPLMLLEEKIAQLAGVWVGAEASGEGVAPHQSDMINEPLQWNTVIRHGLGQLTRPFGTAPIDPVVGARSLAASQAQIVAASRFGIPAQVHEECLTGFAAWRATVYPTPLRDEWGFTGTVVSDYFSLRFLQTLHGVAERSADAARLALRAGIDVELPTVDTSGIPAAVAAAAAADVCVLAVGDRAGMFGRGTSGEGCDAADLQLPGVQAELVRAVLATGNARGPELRPPSYGIVVLRTDA